MPDPPFAGNANFTFPMSESNSEFRFAKIRQMQANDFFMRKAGPGCRRMNCILFCTTGIIITISTLFYTSIILCDSVRHTALSIEIC